MTTLEGIDVSHWQPTTPSLIGLSFLFAKATEGSNLRDPLYATHTAAARAAGLVVGAYHFGVSGDGSTQARAFLSVAADADLLALDLESSAAPMTDAQATAFIVAVHAAGRQCGLYHSLSGYRFLGQDWDWVAAWRATPPVTHWTFWQWQGSPLDKNKFNGDLASLRALAGVTGGDMRSFNQPTIGGAHLVGTGHMAVPLDGSPWDGPWPAGTNWAISGEATLDVPLPGGVVGADRARILLVRPTTTHDGKPWTAAKPAFILRMDTDWPAGKTAVPILAPPPDTSPFGQADIDAAVAADRKLAHITWTLSTQ